MKTIGFGFGFDSNPPDPNPFNPNQPDPNPPEPKRDFGRERADACYDLSVAALDGRVRVLPTESHKRVPLGDRITAK